MAPEQLNDIFQKACSESVIEFLSTSGEVKLDKAHKTNDQDDLTEVYGPSIECISDNVKYVFTLRYELDQNEDYLDLFIKKYPFVENTSIPNIDLNDFLGEFLNIMAGKINKSLEHINPKLQPKAPFFTEGFEHIDNENNVQYFECEFDKLKFTLFYQASIN